MKKSITKNPVRNLFRVLVCALVLLGLSATNTSAQSIIIGAGTGTTNSSTADPIERYYNYTHFQMVWTAAELTAAGLPSGAVISGMGFSVSESAVSLSNYTISMGHTAQTTANPMVALAGLTTVKSAFTYAPTVQTAGNFDMITFGTNFTWNGTQSIVVNTCTGSNPFTSPYGGLRFTTGATCSYFRTDGTSNCATVASPSTTTSRPNIKFNYTGGSACVGTPAPGNTISSANPICSGVSFTLSLQTSTSGSGVTYQWQKDTGAGYSNVAGATSASLTTTQTVATSYKCLVTCSGNTGTSTAVAVGQNAALACYCTPPQSTNFGCCSMYMSNVVTTLGLSNFSNASTEGAASYQNYSATKIAGQLQGGTVNIAVTTNGYGLYMKAWIDFNDNGSFSDAGEQVLGTGSTPGQWGGTSVGTYNQTFTVPAAAPAGTHRMRIRSEYYGSGQPTDPCYTAAYGETEDYGFTVTVPLACSGTPAPGNTLTSASPVCASTSFTLSLQNAGTIGSGATYQWQANTGGGMVNVAGQTTNSYTATQSATTSYQCMVTCSNGGASAASTPVTVTQNSFLGCYCIGTGNCAGGDHITSVNFNSGAINNASGACLGSGGNTAYSDYSAQSANVTSGNTYPISVSVNNGGTEYAGVWIDYNQSGTFDAGEYTAVTLTLATTWNGTANITIPGGATPGTTRMRVRSEYSTPITSANACTALTYSETEDYTIVIAAPAPCVGTPAPGNTNSTGSSVCSGGSVTLSLQNVTAGAGVTYQWYDGASPIGGATLATYTTPALTISHTYYCAVTCSAGPATGNSTATTVTVTSPPVGGTATGPATGLTGNALSYNVTGTTGNLQWQVSTTAAAGPYTDIVGATTAAASLTASGGGTYYIRCKAYGSGCTDSYSNVITTVVTIANDLPCNALALAIGTNGPYSNSGATADAGEAVPTATVGCNVQNAWCENGAQNSLWFTFVGPASGKVTVQAPGFDDQLAVYSATTCGNYTTYTLLAANDDGGSGINGGVTYSALITTLCVTPGATYYVQLDGYSGTVGSTTILLNSVANTAPVITGCPSNISVGNTAGLCTGTATWTAPTAADADACGALTFTSNYAPGATFPSGASTVTYTANDGSNTVTCSFTVTVNDVEAPVITVPATDMTVVTNGAGNAFDFNDWLITNWGNADATDNCSSAAQLDNYWVNDYVASNWVTDCGTAKHVTVGFYVHDFAGNWSAWTYATFHIIDNVAPSISVPATANITSDAGICTSSASIGTATGTDVGSSVTITNNNPGPYTLGANTVIWTATDACGNTTSGSQTVNVTDTQNPTIATNSNITHTSDAGVCTAVVTFASPSAADNCSVSSVVCSPASGSTFASGTTTVTCVATDGSGNTATSTFTVTVTDNQNPTIATNSNITQTSDAGVCTAVVTFASPLAADNCSVSSVVCTPASGSTFASGATTVTCVATDGSGNTATSTFTVTVTDNQNPTITAPADVTVCNGQTVVLGTPATADNCTVASVTNDHPSSTYASGTTVVTWTVTDGSGNTATATQNVLVNVLPVGSASSIVICNNDPSNLPLSGGASYTWTSSVTTGSVFGNQDCASGCGTTISDVLTNLGTVHGVVLYTITPTSALGCVGAPFTASVTIGAAPATPVITGPSVVCGMNTATYSVAAVPEATSYFWTVPPFTTTGMTITSGQGTNTITVSITGGTVSGFVTCQSSNNCLPSNAAASMAVTKKPAVPGAIAGPTSTCGLTTTSYSIASVFGATSYAWTVPANMTITSGQGSTAIVVTMTSAFIYGQVKVSAVNACGNIPGTAITVTGNVPTTPGTISGPTNVCGMTTATYSVPAVLGATGYSWTITGAGTIVGSNTGTSVTVALNGTTGGTISCAATDVCGNSTPRTLALVVTAIQAGLISGPTTLCGGTATQTWSVASVGTGYTYNWNLTMSGWSITSGQGTTSITATGPVSGTINTTGQVRLTTTNSCGQTSLYRTLTVSYCHNGIAMNNGVEATSTTFSNIYPNPTASEFTIDVTSELDQDVTVEVYDMLGNLVIQTKHQLVSGTNTMKTNIEEYKNGMYFVRLLDVDSNVIHSQTVVKQ